MKIRPCIILFIINLCLVSGISGNTNLLTKMKYQMYQNPDTIVLNSLLTNGFNTDWKSFNDFIYQELSKGNELYLSTVLPDTTIINPVLLIYSYTDNFKVFLEDDIIYTYNQLADNTEPGQKLYQPHTIELTDNWKNKRITLYFRLKSESHIKRLSYLYFGTQSKIATFSGSHILYKLKQQLIPIIVISILIFMGIVSLIIFVLRIKHKDYPFLYYGFFAIMSGFSSLHDPFIITLLGVSEQFFNLFILIPVYGATIFFLLFTKSTFDTQWRKIVNIVVFIDLLAFLLSIVIIQFCNDLCFTHIIFVMITLSLSSIIIGIYTIFKSKFYKIISKDRTFRLSLLIFAVLSVVSILLAGNREDEELFLFAVLFLSFGMMSVLAGYFNQSMQKASNLKIEFERSKAELLEARQANMQAQFETLKSQINPHFLFNSLNALSSLCYPNPQPEKAKRFIDGFSKIFRYILEIKDKEVIELHRELDFLNSYYYLQKIRFGNDLQMDIKLDKSLHFRLIPPLTLQILVENAIKHNVVNAEKPLQISIHFDNDYLVVTNTFNPRNKSEVTSTYTGHRNIEERYRLISDELPEYKIENNLYIAKIPLLNDE